MGPWHLEAQFALRGPATWASSMVRGKAVQESQQLHMDHFAGELSWRNLGARTCPLRRARNEEPSRSQHRASGHLGMLPGD
ncbi:hypothetical protein NDU88_006199 [Pleurodeles waltl]|uniref:Uncharacterized protein n=1 Tax=Pleurodeles waltl TaxID=8319 RepID=A0AAV7RRF3_PLEWA|nr:hypothetical protein NDU88_006199 [Pleurodeles waltl]